MSLLFKLHKPKPPKPYSDLTPKPRNPDLARYSMGLFHASRKRLVVSWAMVCGVAVVVAGCKRLPMPHRAIVDGGVVVGLR